MRTTLALKAPHLSPEARKSFFDTVRDKKYRMFNRLTTKQVSGFESLLEYAASRDTPRNHLAYILATTYLETGATMQPIREFFAKTDEDARRLARRYYPTKYGKPDGKYRKYYYGRGYVMITWLFNYENATEKLREDPAVIQYCKVNKRDLPDLVKNPEEALEPFFALVILFRGMEEGWFTGKELDDYIDTSDDGDEQEDFRRARRIVNGTDKDQEIAKYALVFEQALIDMGWPEVPTFAADERKKEMALLPPDVVGDKTPEPEPDLVVEEQIQPSEKDTAMKVFGVLLKDIVSSSTIRWNLVFMALLTTVTTWLIGLTPAELEAFGLSPDSSKMLVAGIGLLGGIINVERRFKTTVPLKGRANKDS